MGRCPPERALAVGHRPVELDDIASPGAYASGRRQLEVHDKDVKRSDSKAAFNRTAIARPIVEKAILPALKLSKFREVAGRNHIGKKPFFIKKFDDSVVCVEACRSDDRHWSRL